MRSAVVDESGVEFGPMEWAASGSIALIWGSSFLFIAIAIDHVDVTVVPFARCLFGATTLALFRNARRRIAPADRPRIAFLGLCWMGIPFLLYPIAEQTVNTSITGMINGGIPIATAVVTALFTRVVPSVFRMAAVSIGGAGIAVISLTSVSGHAGADAKGVILLLVAVACYAVAANVARPVQSRYGAMTTMLWIEIAALLWSTPLGLNGLRHSDFAWSALAALAALGAIGTGAAFAIYAVLLQRAGPVRAMIGIFFTPVVGTILGVAFRDDELHAAAIVGMGIVIIGAVMTSRPEPDRVATPSRQARRQPDEPPPGLLAGSDLDL